MKEELSIGVQIAILAIQLGLIIFAARFCGELAKKMKVPSVLGELIAGIIIGPYVLGAIGIPLHGFEHGLFPIPHGSAIPVSTPLYGIATLGSILLLFMSGLETDLRMFFRYSVAGTIVGLGGVIFSFAFGVGLGVIGMGLDAMAPQSLFLGILSTATSVGITARILSENKSIDSPEGTTILAAAVIDDVLGIVCLAVVMGIISATNVGGTGKVDWSAIGLIAVRSFGIWLGVTAIGLAFAHHIAKFLKWFRPSGVFAILAFALALLLAGLFEQAGLAMIVGAYVMGLSLSKTDISFSVQRSLHGVYNFLVPIFFVVMGMLVDVRVLTDAQVLKFGLIYSAIAIAAKVIGCALPAYCMNFNMIGSLRIGAGMIPRGEVALIIAGIGATTMMRVGDKMVPVVGKELFGVAIIMTLMTTLVAPPILSFMLGIKRKGVRKEVQDHNAVHTVYPVPSEVIRDFIMRGMIENFRREGFRHSEVDKDGGIIHFRRDSRVFSLAITDRSFDFESNPDEVVLIKTVMYETFIELHHSLTKLKTLANPGGMDQVIKNDALPVDVKAKGRVKLGIRCEKIIPADCVLTDLQETSSEGVIREMVNAISASGRLDNAEQCLEDVMSREAIVPTCVPGGIALPHCRTAGASALTAAIGISRKGCDCNAADGKKTHIFVLSICPKGGDGPYLQFMAHVASILASDDRVREIQRLAEAGDAQAVRGLFINNRK